MGMSRVLWDRSGVQWTCLEHFGTGRGAMKIIRTKIKTKNDNLRL